MEKKGLIFFTVSINLLCLVYGCICIIWCYWGIEVLLGSIINIISMIFCIKMLAEHSRKGRIVVASAAVMLFIYAFNVDPVFRTRGTQMLICGNCFKQLPSLNNILLGLNIRLWNVI